MAFGDCDLDTATEVLERVQLQLQSALRGAGLPCFTASFGVTAALLAEDLDVLVARADTALFQAKRSGRDRVVAFPPGNLEITATRDVLVT